MTIRDNMEAPGIPDEETSAIPNEGPEEDVEGDRKNSPALVEKFVIRLPSGLRTKLKQLSEQNRRSMNAEIIMVLEKHIRQSLEGMELPDGVDAAELTAKQLTDMLDSLPPEKKEALLELLG